MPLIEARQVTCVRNDPEITLRNCGIEADPDMQREETVVVTLHDERPIGAGADRFKVFYAQLVQDFKDGMRGIFLRWVV